MAPLWAALITLINQDVAKPIGFINPLLYQSEDNSEFNDITSGSNGAYRAGPGWDACTGLGSPVGSQLAAALSTDANPTKVMKTGT